MDFSEINMGKMKQHPRYNVISLRVSDEELTDIKSEIGPGTRQNWLMDAVTEKLARARQKGKNQ